MWLRNVKKDFVHPSLSQQPSYNNKAHVNNCKVNNKSYFGLTWNQITSSKLVLILKLIELNKLIETMKPNKRNEQILWIKEEMCHIFISLLYIFVYDIYVASHFSNPGTNISQVLICVCYIEYNQFNIKMIIYSNERVNGCHRLRFSQVKLQPRMVISLTMLLILISIIISLVYCSFV